MDEKKRKDEELNEAVEKYFKEESNEEKTKIEVLDIAIKKSKPEVYPGLVVNYIKDCVVDNPSIGILKIESMIIGINKITEFSKPAIKKIIYMILKSEQKRYNDLDESSLNLFVQNKETIAETFYKLNPFFYDDIGLFWFWNSDKCCYERKNELKLMNELKDLASNKDFPVTSNTFWTETNRALKLIGCSHVPKEFDKKWIQFGKTVYNYETKKKFKASPDYFNVNPIPYELGKHDKTPKIDKLFTEWVGEENVLTLKESIALSTMQDYRLHRIVYLVGSGLNGKGEFLRFKVKFLGSSNTCSSNLKKLIRSNFECSKLYKKLACDMGETDFSILEDTSLLKQLTGQDLVSAEFKGKDSFDFENYATIFIASNSLPITMDKTKGFYRRSKIIDFPNTFEEGKDILKRIPDVEYNNLCCQILKIIPKLIKRGQFHRDGDIETRTIKYEEKSNPLQLFINRNYIKDINSDILYYEFFDEFSIFCNNSGFREISKKEMTKLLDSLGFDTKKKDILVNDEYKKYVHIVGMKKIIVPIVPIVPTPQLISRKGNMKLNLGTIGTIGTKKDILLTNKKLRKRILKYIKENMPYLDEIIAEFSDISEKEIENMVNYLVSKTADICYYRGTRLRILE